MKKMVLRIKNFMTEMFYGMALVVLALCFLKAFKQIWIML